MKTKERSKMYGGPKRSVTFCWCPMSGDRQWWVLHEVARTAKRIKDEANKSIESINKGYFVNVRAGVVDNLLVPRCSTTQEVASGEYYGVGIVAWVVRLFNNRCS